MNVLQKIMRVLCRTVKQLLLVEDINTVIYLLRFYWFVRVKKTVKTFQTTDHVIAADYSIDMLLKGRTSHRPLRLIRPLSVIDTVPKNEARVLSVGCRFETELLYLVGHGFKSENIRGLDMVSYSPWVDVGNMHSMPYADNSWDVVLLGWVLPYSDNQPQAAAEVIRVAKDKAIIAIGLGYKAQNTQDALAGGDLRILTGRIQTVDGLLALFGSHVGRVFFRHDAADPANDGNCVVLFEIRKPALSHQ